MSSLTRTAKVQHLAGDNILHRDLAGGDPSFAYKANHFTYVNMACLKSLTHNTNQPSYRKAHSFSEDTSSTPQMRQMEKNCHLIGKSFSLPFDFNQRRLDTLPLLSCLKPAKSNRDLFGCESCHQGGDLANMLQNLNNCILDRMHTNIMPMVKETMDKERGFILSAFAAPAVNGMSSCAQPGLLVKTAAPQPVNCSVLEDSSLAAATIDNTCNCEILKKTLQDNNTETSVAPSSIGESHLTCGSNSNDTVESNRPVGMSSHYECLSNLSADKCCLHESNNSSSNTQNCKLVMESKPTVGENTSQSALKPIFNLTSVLSAPRKTIKKGRPSSKKQKKRQREKQRHGLQPFQTKEMHDSTHTGCDTEQRLHSQIMESVCDRRSKLDTSPVSPCNPKFETAREAFNPTCPMTHLFVSLMSCSEDENCFEDDDDHDNDDKNDSVSKHKEVPRPPIKGFGFGCALDLDTIFKKNIPQSCFNAEKKTDAKKKKDYKLCSYNGFQKNFCQSSLEHDSFDKSSTTSALPVLKDADSCFFTPALSLDILFCKKPTCSSQAAVDLQESTFDLLDDVPSDENIDLLPSSRETDSESLQTMNALWNENYPTAGFRSCSSVSTDEIKHPTIKVHFAAKPHFLTVHIIGTEERNGNWHHVIRERENFERRILELEQILSPVLEASHRAKVLEQRKGQEQQ